jgi:hypothetical protein
MVQIYGHRWLSAYGDATEEGVMSETAKTWQKALRGVTYEQIARGLAKCLESGNSWPPSLPEFRALCLGNYTEQPKQNAAAYRAPECLKLVRPKGNSEVARAHLQAMRRMLGRGAEADCVQERPTTERVHSQVEKAPISSTEAQTLYSDAPASSKDAESAWEPVEAQQSVKAEADGQAQANILYSDGIQPCVKEKSPNYAISEHRTQRQVEMQQKDTIPTPKSNLGPICRERNALADNKPWCKSWSVSKYARGQGSKLPLSAPSIRGQPQAFTVQGPQPP